MTYRLVLSPQLSDVLLVFLVSILMRYYFDNLHKIRLDYVILHHDLLFMKEPIAILHRQTMKLSSKHIYSVKVQWRHHPIEEAMWEVDFDMRYRYPLSF